MHVVVGLHRTGYLVGGLQKIYVGAHIHFITTLRSNLQDCKISSRVKFPSWTKCGNTVFWEMETVNRIRVMHLFYANAYAYMQSRSLKPCWLGCVLPNIKNVAQCVNAALIF